MCDLCKDGIACPGCGRLVCWDIDGGDDIMAQAAATASGDLMCLYCAVRRDREMERADEDYYPGPWDE